MDKVKLQNYRCFGNKEQAARLAPLTLLVGPNSTGKTSFLALIRALWDVAFREVVPNFREPPYDLGSFEDIAHDSGRRGGKAKAFTVGLEFLRTSQLRGNGTDSTRFTATFENRSTGPFPVERGFSDSLASIDILSSQQDEVTTARFRVGQTEWNDQLGYGTLPERVDTLPSFDAAVLRIRRSGEREGSFPASEPDKGELKTLEDLLYKVRDYAHRRPRVHGSRPRPLRRFRDRGANRPFAGAPLRSHPNRTYDPVRLAQDAQGEYIPSYLANLSRRDPGEWQTLKNRLETFGKDSGLFDEITVRPFGKSDGDPFQIQIRKFGNGRKGPQRNLIDVGYGISQALPILTELFRNDAPSTFLLQQPEVHLHPQAQATLGTLLGSVAAGGRQLFIETHSDYIIDRVRMDVRDQTTGLKPADVSILYFEPNDLDVQIHSIQLDEMGNVHEAPIGYRQFFADELRRSIGL